MKFISLASICFVMSVNSLFAQASDQPVVSVEKPPIKVAVYSDNTLVDQQTGVKIDTKEFRFDASLDRKVASFSDDFKSELRIENTQVLLIRNGRKLAQVNIPNADRASNLIQRAQPGDHVTFVFTLAAQRKNGQSIILSARPTYTFLARK
ncbi:hypothetical protein [Spirosoma rigui]|uniref:hypothetical protein n=1 Tax=Spirosoma rigui TaxID=564064 RepID=UPI0009B18CC0|nr:hypothetical protein [Spirosoma rigui]